MPELFEIDLPAWANILIGAGLALFSVWSFRLTRKDTQQSSVFQSRDRLREKYQTISFRVMDLVGKLSVPISNEDYLRFGYELEQIYSGEARLLRESGSNEELIFKPDPQNASDKWQRDWKDDDGSALYALGVFTDLIAEAWPDMAYGKDGIDEIAHTSQRYEKLDETGLQLAKRLNGIIYNEYSLKSVKIGSSSGSNRHAKSKKPQSAD